ncbi:hypothetical protein [Providencia sp. JUb39]|uniref:hypothetical protein n=1 Tax=Providencia sp. JUb39 TaxID=2724165 RepID=UPI00164DD3EE|nr:hypothetical protein [Providencia sp. JUb39]MBC5790598.1 hypothetical protein [Providencia sp. JUb39]
MDLFERFPTYTVQQLSGIFVNGISPESMTHDFPASMVKHKKFKSFLRNPESSDVFCVSTQTKRPKFRYRVGQEVDVINPYNFDPAGEKVRAIVVGEQRFYLRGMSFNGYILEYIS